MVAVRVHKPDEEQDAQIDVRRRIRRQNMRKKLIGPSITEKAFSLGDYISHVKVLKERGNALVHMTSLASKLGDPSLTSDVVEVGVDAAKGLAHDIRRLYPSLSDLTWELRSLRNFEDTDQSLADLLSVPTKLANIFRKLDVLIVRMKCEAMYDLEGRPFDETSFVVCCEEGEDRDEEHAALARKFEQGNLNPQLLRCKDILTPPAEVTEGSQGVMWRIFSSWWTASSEEYYEPREKDEAGVNAYYTMTKFPEEIDEWEEEVEE